MNLESKSLRCRTDEFSIQYTLEGSKRFFIRLDTDKSEQGKLIFTDITFDYGESTFASEAFCSILVGFLKENIDIIVYDIAPNEENLADKNSEIVINYDRIIEMIRRSLTKLNYRILKSNLNYRLDRFDIMLSSEVAGGIL